jgi:hypothetical protein
LLPGFAAILSFVILWATREESHQNRMEPQVDGEVAFSIVGAPLLPAAPVMLAGSSKQSKRTGGKPP